MEALFSLPYILLGQSSPFFPFLDCLRLSVFFYFISEINPNLLNTGIFSKSHIWTSQQYSVSSVQFSCSLVSDSLQPHESQHTRPPCPSPAAGVYSNSCSLSRWCHPAISSSVIPFSSCPQSLPASGSFPMSQLFTWGLLSYHKNSQTLIFISNLTSYILSCSYIFFHVLISLKFEDCH